MSQPTLTDYQWLTSPAAEHWLALTQGSVSAALVSRLRQDLTAVQTHLVLKQSELRARARQKFSDAERVFFTDLGLQQATSQRVADYKASLLPSDGVIADLCCGIGGDLMSIAEAHQTIGYDRDPISAWLAQANLERTNRNGQVVSADVTPQVLTDVAAWHLDPDRRPAGHRTTCVDLHQPNAACMDALLAACPDALIKLAPAADLPTHWRTHAQAEWIGADRECKQLLVRFGRFAERLGRRSATILARDQAPFRFHSRADAKSADEIAFADTVHRYVFEPHAAVLAAGLADEFASAHNLQRLNRGVAYFTSEHPVMQGGNIYETLADLPFDSRNVRALLRKNQWRVTEVKKRGTQHEPATILRELRCRDGDPVTLLIFPRGDNVKAIIARRVVP